MNDDYRDGGGARDRELKADKEELLRLLLQEDEPRPERTSDRIELADRSAPLPLSFAQERLWFLEALEQDPLLFQFNLVLTLRGPLDAEALACSLNAIVARHEALRLAINSVDGVLRQAAAPNSDVRLTITDISERPAHERKAVADTIAKAEASDSFDLTRPPFIRGHLVRLSPNEHRLILALHHIAVDDTSMEILLRELSAAYDAFASGRQPHFPDLPIQYADFAQHQRDWLSGERLGSLLRHWKKTLEGLPGPLGLPFDRPRPPVQSLKGQTVEFAFPLNLSSRLRAFSRASGVTLFTTLLGIFKVLLHRYSAQDDIFVGTPFANRGWVETEGVIGLFINNVVLRTDLSRDPNFREVVTRLRDVVLSAVEHQDLPFERLVQELNLPRDRSHSPIFQVMFVLLSGGPQQLVLKNLDVSVERSEKTFSEFDLSLYLRDNDSASEGAPQPITGYFEFCTALFDAVTVERMAGHLQALANAVIDNPDVPISRITMMGDDERQSVISKWNQTAAPVPRVAGFHALFEQQVARNPDRVAAVFGDVQLTYRELDTSANRLSKLLQAKGVRPGTIVAIVVERTPNMLIGLIAVLKAGGAYLPIDPSYPAERIAHMVTDSGACLCLTSSETVEALPHVALETVVLDRDWAQVETYDDSPLPPTATDQDLAYVIYTSGSTGLPKGVEVEHRNVVNFLAGMADQPGLEPEDRFLAVTTISFDIHVLELFLPLSVGACVVVASRHDAADGARLLEIVRTRQITAMQATPVTWRLMMESGWTERLPLKALCGGEGWPPGLASALLSRCSDVWNLYGPTETTVWSSATRITDPDEAVTVGYPMVNTQFHVVGNDFAPVPIGVSGELLIGGAGVARGYHDRADLTKERFVVDVSPGLSGRHYRTGDLARRLHDGRILLLGRLDNQTKLRGYRIELGEIEAALIDHQAVREAVVVVREDEPGEKRLVAYLIAAGTYRPNPATLRSELRRRLPEFMIPLLYVWLDRMPMTPNGKVNRQALPKPNPVQPGTSNAAPMSDSEKLISGIFRDVLGAPSVGRLDNFFDLGGHSLLSLKVLDRFEKATGTKLPPGVLFQQSVAQIAAAHDKSISSQGATGSRRKSGMLGLLPWNRRSG